MPDGLVYQGVSEEPMAYSGGSAAQSTVLHAFDELLGIRHGPESGESRTCLFPRTGGETEPEQPPQVRRTRTRLKPDPAQSPAGTRLGPVCREKAYK